VQRLDAGGARHVADSGGARHVAHVLLVLQAALILLAGLGELLLMGNPAYLPLVLGGPSLLLVVASAVGRGRRWGLVAAIVIQAVPLGAYQVSLLLGLLPQLDVTVNLVGLLANVALPLVVSWQCLRVLTGLDRAGRRGTR
jgi:hypothetical protein